MHPEELASGAEKSQSGVERQEGNERRPFIGDSSSSTNHLLFFRVCHFLVMDNVASVER